MLSGDDEPCPRHVNDLSSVGIDMEEGFETDMHATWFWQDLLKVYASIPRVLSKMRDALFYFQLIFLTCCLFRIEYKGQRY